SAPPADQRDTGQEHGPRDAAEHGRASASPEAYERHEEEPVEAGGGEGGRDTGPQPPRQRVGEPGQVRDRTEGGPEHRYSRDVAGAQQPRRLGHQRPDSEDGRDDDGGVGERHERAAYELTSRSARAQPDFAAAGSAHPE